MALSKCVRSILVSDCTSFLDNNLALNRPANCDELIVNLDKLTYAGNHANPESVCAIAQPVFMHRDIGASEKIATLLAEYQPREEPNFSAESLVDRTMHGPVDVIHTNKDQYSVIPRFLHTNVSDAAAQESPSAG